MDRGGHIQELRQRIEELEAENEELREKIQGLCEHELVDAPDYGCQECTKCGAYV